MISDHFTDIQGLILDMDGVLWHDSEPLGDLPAIFRKIEAMGIKVILVTNNATRTIAEYHTKLKGFGVELEAWQVITSGQAVGIYLQKTYPDGADIYVVGQPSLRNSLADLNFHVMDEDGTSADVVVASLDYGLTYDKLRQASLLIQNGSFFVGTNPDVTLPTPQGLIPGSGTVIGALEIASGKKAHIIGKPEPALYEIALERLNISPNTALAVGDRLETDIKGADAAGIHTALVLSGASTLSQAREYRPQPELIVNNLTELVF
jgi:4-nitrophenyl phosphatase